MEFWNFRRGGTARRDGDGDGDGDATADAMVKQPTMAVSFER